MSTRSYCSASLRHSVAPSSQRYVRLEQRGLIVTIRRSKTDQEGKGVEIAVPIVASNSLRAVRAVKAWLDASGIAAGPLFRSFALQCQMLETPLDGRDVANLVKKLTSEGAARG